MKAKNILTSAIVLLAIGYILNLLSCGSDGNKTEKQEGKQTVTEGPQSLNISIFLDLSDRLTRSLTPAQMSRDTAIIGNILDYFKAQTLGPQILKSTNNIKVFFYPAPAHSQIATLASDLNVDMALLTGKDKRVRLEGMKEAFQNSLSQIYGKTMQQQNWIGCDIWDFFSSKKVDAQCIRKDCRNVLFILTDGYLFDANHKMNDGSGAYSYILPQTLADKNSSLIVKRDGLENLEVCILEVNPYDIKHKEQMIDILHTWLVKMGVKEQNICIAETDLPINTKTIIKSFLDR